MFRIRKGFEHPPNSTSENFYTWAHAMGKQSKCKGAKKYGIKFPQAVCLMWNIKFEFKLGFLPQDTSGCVQNEKNSSKSEMLLITTILDKEYLTCIHI